MLAELLVDAAVGAVGWFVAPAVDDWPSAGIVVVVASVPANVVSSTTVVVVVVRNARSKIDGTGSSSIVVASRGDESKDSGN